MADHYQIGILSGFILAHEATQLVRLKNLASVVTQVDALRGLVMISTPAALG